ncbi:uncharacterized protein [Parasteatoda tepidariorum]|uniref:uncharacterized protein n=1 Tax=Parasteatoda tepidariorum TaxID=114398 RepID=UPI0039BC83D2
MPVVMNTCCCWKRVKSGSYASGLYTLILYTAMFIAGIVHAQTINKSPSLLAFCLLMVVLSGTCIICSMIMLLGLYKNNRFLLLPWTVAVAMTTLIDVMVSFYLIRDAITEPFLAVVFVTDVLICAVNVYALLCVLSQYQEYKLGLGRNNAAQPRDLEAAAPQPRKPQVTSSITDDVSTTALLPPSSTSPMKAGPVIITQKFISTELTTISEEVHSVSPSSPKELCTSFIDSKATDALQSEI